MRVVVVEIAMFAIAGFGLVEKRLERVVGYLESRVDQ